MIELKDVWFNGSYFNWNNMRKIEGPMDHEETLFEPFAQRIVAFASFASGRIKPSSLRRILSGNAHDIWVHILRLPRLKATKNYSETTSRHPNVLILEVWKPEDLIMLNFSYVYLLLFNWVNENNSQFRLFGDSLPLTISDLRMRPCGSKSGSMVNISKVNLEHVSWDMEEKEKKGVFN